MKYLAITAILCLILAGASFAGNVTMTEVITGGNLTLTMPSDFSLSGALLGGSASFNYQQLRYYTIEDSRGTGAGWNVGFQCSQFVTSGTPQRSINIERFEMCLDSGNITKLYGQTKDNTYGPLSSIGSYTNIQTSEVKGITSATNYGMGKYEAYVVHRLIIYAYDYAGTYTATLTATLNAVP